MADNALGALGRTRVSIRFVGAALPGLCTDGHCRLRVRHCRRGQPKKAMRAQAAESRMISNALHPRRPRYIWRVFPAAPTLAANVLMKRISRRIATWCSIPGPPGSDYNFEATAPAIKRS